MLKTLLFSIIILSVAMFFLLVKVVFRRGGSFASQHIHDSEAMRQRGIHCVVDQDREERERRARLKEKAER
jgi:hypothetical protein